jgi:hypothetical protein
MNRLFVTASALTLMTACGSMYPTKPSLTAAGSNAEGAKNSNTKRPLLIDTLAISPINGGINPSYKGYDLKARVKIAGNTCMAEGVKAELTSARDGDKLIVKAVRNIIKDRVCTMEYNPVYATIKTTIHFDSTEVKDVIIENYKEMGAKVSLKDIKE